MNLAARLRAGEAVHSAWSGLPDAMTVEAVARLGFDAVTLDMQHGAHHEDSVARGMAPIIAANRHAVVRVPVGRFDMASRALDLGAEAVIAPMVNTIEDARAFAASMKYPPIGERSWGPTIAMNRTGRTDPASWLATANGETLAFAMIETRAALAILDDILAMDGIDGVFVGPSDFSIAFSGGRAVNPAMEEMVAAVATIGAKAREAGKLAAIYIGDAKRAGLYHAMGFRLFAYNNESAYMNIGASNILAAARSSIEA